MAAKDDKTVTFTLAYPVSLVAERLIGRRLVALPVMVLGVTLLVLVVMSFSPADPARLALGEAASQEAIDAYRERNGLNDPLLVRYVRFLGGLLRGDLGVSAGNLPVTDFVARAFPITLQLTLVGLVIAVALALVLGIVAALYRDRWPDQLIRVLSIAALATPSFWLAILLIQWLSTVPGGAGLYPAVVSTWVPFREARPRQRGPGRLSPLVGRRERRRLGSRARRAGPSRTPLRDRVRAAGPLRGRRRHRAFKAALEAQGVIASASMPAPLTPLSPEDRAGVGAIVGAVGLLPAAVG